MTDRLPRLTAKDIIRILEKNGFVLARTSGSHMIYKDSSRHRVTVPLHGGKILHPKVLQSILRDMEISEDDLKALLYN